MTGPCLRKRANERRVEKAPRGGLGAHRPRRAADRAGCCVGDHRHDLRPALGTVEDIVGGTRGQLAAALAVGPVLRGRLAAQPFRFSNAGDGEWLLANVSGVRHLAKSFIVLCCFGGIAALLSEARKAVLIQRVTAVRSPPANTRSSCRKERNSTADHDWPFMTLLSNF